MKDLRSVISGYLGLTTTTTHAAAVGRLTTDIKESVRSVGGADSQDWALARCHGHSFAIVLPLDECRVHVSLITELDRHVLDRGASKHQTDNSTETKKKGSAHRTHQN